MGTHMARRQESSRNRHKDRGLKKFFRLVALLTVKKYGTWIILNLYFTALLGAGIGAMDEIWSEFQRYQTCQENYITNVAGTVTSSYNKAAHALARSSLGRAECHLSEFDFCKRASTAAKGVAEAARNVVGGRRLSQKCAPTGLVNATFSWSAPGSITFPTVNMNITSNTGEVVESVQDDLNILKEMAKWTRYAGYILAAFSIILILFTATIYTVRRKAWKPSRKSYTMHLLNVLRVVGAYGIAMLVVFLQAYSTDKFCNVSIRSISMDTPACDVNGNCNFNCKVRNTVFPNTCEECDIKLHWWWVETFALPNIMAVVFFVFLIMVLIFECFESRFEQKELGYDAQESTQEKRKHRQKSVKEQKAPLVSEADGDSAVVQMEVVQQQDHNVLDAPVEAEKQPSKPQTRYESSVYMYPEKRYTGGLY